MSAVRKPENPDVIPIRAVEPAPDEPPFTTEDQMFCPPAWGPYTHSEADLRIFWSRIWRAFKSRRLCEGFLQMNKSHSLECWAAAFEVVRQGKDPGFEVINYVKRIADRFAIEGTPAQKAEREAAKVEQAKKTMKAQLVDPEDPDIKAFEKRSKTISLDDIGEDNPMYLRYKNRNRGCK